MPTRGATPMPFATRDAVLARKARVLICEETPRTRELIQTVLGNGYDFTLTDSGEAAIGQALAHPPDIILTDLELPGIDGVELCHRLRSAPITEATPIVVITSLQNDDSRARSIESGADDYLFKPIRPREVRARVASLVRLKVMRENLEARTVELERANAFLTQAQQALVRSEKLAMVGTLVAGVAHEINNPLAYIRSGLSGLGSCLADLKTYSGQLLDPAGFHAALVEADEILKEVETGAGRIQRICSDFKMIASTRPPDPAPVVLHEEVSQAWRIAAHQADAVQFDLQIDPTLVIQSVSHLLGQVLLNLFLNAVQAMTGRGRVVCRASVEGRDVLLTVSDTGPGIPAHQLSRVFDPFFTTKPIGQGTGLGLAVSQSIVQSLGGSLNVASPCEGGAVFTLRLPCAGPSVGLDRKVA